MITAQLKAIGVKRRVERGWGGVGVGSEREVFGWRETMKVEEKKVKEERWKEGIERSIEYERRRKRGCEIREREVHLKNSFPWLGESRTRSKVKGMKWDDQTRCRRSSFVHYQFAPKEKNYPNNKHIFTTITDILLCGFSTIFVFRGFVFLIIRSLPREEK